jgi:energy-coupling factor transporter transmembrane protein EcfT
VSDDRPTRRDLMKPVQLLGLAFGAALFAGVVTLVSMGFFQGAATGEERQAAVVLALIIAGISFIAVLVIVALLLLAIDPAQITKTIDRPVLLDKGDEDTDAAASGDSPKS